MNTPELIVQTIQIENFVDKVKQFPTWPIIGRPNDPAGKVAQIFRDCYYSDNYINEILSSLYRIDLSMATNLPSGRNEVEIKLTALDHMLPTRNKMILQFSIYKYDLNSPIYFDGQQIELLLKLTALQRPRNTRHYRDRDIYAISPYKAGLAPTPTLSIGDSMTYNTFTGFITAIQSLVKNNIHLFFIDCRSVLATHIQPEM